MRVAQANNYLLTNVQNNKQSFSDGKNSFKSNNRMDSRVSFEGLPKPKYPQGVSPYRLALGLKRLVIDTIEGDTRYQIRYMSGVPIKTIIADSLGHVKTEHLYGHLNYYSPRTIIETRKFSPSSTKLVELITYSSTGTSIKRYSASGELVQTIDKDSFLKKTVQDYNEAGEIIETRKFNGDVVTSFKRFNSGKLIEQVSYWEEGPAKEVRQYTDGEILVQISQYRNNGSLKSISKYREGFLSNKTYCKMDGTVREVKEFVNGQPVSEPNAGAI